MPSRLLPAAVAALIVGVLCADVAVAADLRADRRRAAAAAAEARAVEAYRAKVQPMAERVYDHVQPLQDVADFYLHPSPDALQIALDVYTRSGTKAALVRLRGQLVALPAPTSLRAEAKALVSAADAFVDAAALLEKRPKRPDEVEQVYAAEDVLGGAILTWSNALTEVYGDRPSPLFPAGGTPRPGIRKPVSRAAWIGAADRLCSASIDSGLRLPELETPQQIASAGPRYANLVRGMLTGLGTLTTPAEDRERLRRDVTPFLKTTRAMADGLDALAVAVRTADAAKADRAITTLANGLRASQKLSQGLSRYGATVCSDVFEVDPKDIPGGGRDPGIRA